VRLLRRVCVCCAGFIEMLNNGGTLDAVIAPSTQ